MIDSIVVGLIAAAFTTFAFLPQAIKSFKTKETKDLSLQAFAIALTGVLLWLIYGLLINDLPLILANSVASVIMASILVMKAKYG